MPNICLFCSTFASKKNNYEENLFYMFNGACPIFGIFYNHKLYK